MKTFAWIVVVLLLLIGGAVAYVALNSGSLVKSGIEKFGPQFLGIEVQVDNVDLAITEGSAAINGLRLGNPAGFSGADMMQVDQIKVVLDTSQISDTLVVMKEVVIDGANITAIAKGQQTNFQQLMANLNLQQVVIRRHPPMLGLEQSSSSINSVSPTLRQLWTLMWSGNWR